MASQQQQALVAKGIEVDAMHPDGVSALMYASAGGHPEVVKFLLDGTGPAKAEPNLKHVQVGRGTLVLRCGGGGCCDSVVVVCIARARGDGGRGCGRRRSCVVVVVVMVAILVVIVCIAHAR